MSIEPGHHRAGDEGEVGERHPATGHPLLQLARAWPRPGGGRPRRSSCSAPRCAGSRACARRFAAASASSARAARRAGRPRRERVPRVDRGTRCGVAARFRAPRSPRVRHCPLTRSARRDPACGSARRCPCHRPGRGRCRARRPSAARPASRSRSGRPHRPPGPVEARPLPARARPDAPRGEPRPDGRRRPARRAACRPRPCRPARPGSSRAVRPPARGSRRRPCRWSPGRSVSSASTQSPGRLRHSTIVPSATEMPICGITISVGLRVSRRGAHDTASFMSSSWGRTACSSGGLNGIGTSGAVRRRTGASRSSNASLGDQRRDLGADAAGAGRLVGDQHLAGLLDAREDRLGVERARACAGRSPRCPRRAPRPPASASGTEEP